MQTASRYPWGKGTPRWVRDATADDSDKSFTVPAGKIWQVLQIYMHLTATAAVGDRRPAIEISNGVANIWTGVLGVASASQLAVIEANQTHGSVTTTIRQPITGGANNTNNTAMIPLPTMFLPAGYIIRCWDSAAIAAATDDTVVILHYIEYDA